MFYRVRQSETADEDEKSTRRLWARFACHLSHASFRAMIPIMPGENRARWMTRMVLGFVAAVFCLCVGCTSVDIRPTLLLPKGASRPKSIAVLPFENLTSRSGAAEALTAALVNELKKRSEMEVLEAPAGPTGDRLSAARLGKTLGADAVLLGVVTEYCYGPSAARVSGRTTSNLGVDLRLMAVESRELLWAAGVTARRNQMITYDGITLSELAQVVAERVVSEIDSIGWGI